MSAATERTLYIGERADGEPTFPKRAQFGATWAQMKRLAKGWQQMEPGAFLAEFCGDEAAPPIGIRELVTGVHHAAFYLGDYRDDRDVFDWFSFLNDRATAQEIGAFSMGPSYIAPKEYGTPGWWYSFTDLSGFVIEIFTCRAYGSWSSRAPGERIALMSHLGLTIRSRDEVSPALDCLTGSSANLQRIAFVDGDELGHTYGHVRNNRSKRVVELVHEARPAASELG